LRDCGIGRESDRVRDCTVCFVAMEFKGKGVLVEMQLRELA